MAKKKEEIVGEESFGFDVSLDLIKKVFTIKENNKSIGIELGFNPQTGYSEANLINNDPNRHPNNHESGFVFSCSKPKMIKSMGKLIWGAGILLEKEIKQLEKEHKKKQ